ncbi:MAG TPA: hypothetical protein VMR81_01000 [Patescibacteria group bacterium]|nr:hypothetical protein [Patescibacteria group bacterium]
MRENFLDRLAKVTDSIRYTTKDSPVYEVGNTGLFFRFNHLDSNCRGNFVPADSITSSQDLPTAALYAGMFRIGLGSLHETYRNGSNIPDWFTLTDDTQLIFNTNDRFASAVEKLFSYHGHKELVTGSKFTKFCAVSIQFKKFLELSDDDELIRYLNEIRHGKLSRNGKYIKV